MTEFNAAQARTKRPCPIWVDAFHRDTQHLSADEVGAYFLILMAMWSRESCDLPDDDRRLCRVGKISLRTWNSRVGAVIRDFLMAENGVVFSKRLRKEASYVERGVTHQSDRKKGIKNGKSLKNKKQDQSGDITTDQSGDYPTQRPNDLHIEEPSASSIAGGGYQDFLYAHPKAVENKQGEENWDRLIKEGVDPQILIRAAKRYADRAKDFSNPSFVQQSDNFLDPDRGKWVQHAHGPADPARPSHDQKLEFWAKQAKAGRAFGISDQIAADIVSQKLMTQDEMNQARTGK